MKKPKYNFKFRPFPKTFEYGEYLPIHSITLNDIGFMNGLSTGEFVLAFINDINKPFKSMNEYMAHCQKNGGDKHLEIGLRYNYIWFNGMGYEDKTLAKNFTGNLGELKKLITKKLTQLSK